MGLKDFILPQILRRSFRCCLGLFAEEVLEVLGVAWEVLLSRGAGPAWSFLSTECKIRAREGNSLIQSILSNIYSRSIWYYFA